MELTVQERLVALAVLRDVPPRLTTMRIIHDLQDELGFPDAEKKALEFSHPDDGSVQWNRAADVGKNIEVGDEALSLFMEAFKELDEAEPSRLTMEHHPLYESLLKEQGRATAPVKLAAV